MMWRSVPHGIDLFLEDYHENLRLAEPDDLIFISESDFDYETNRRV